MAFEPFPPPKHGWTCFHCGETLRTIAEAAIHFGTSVHLSPGCIAKVEAGERGLLGQMREVERQRDELEVRLTAARLGLDVEGENEAVERWRATRTVTIAGKPLVV
jgi:hypothetical protein